MSQIGMTTLSWKSVLAQRLSLFGHRNWIGVVDSAYPWQTAPGIETVATGADHFVVLKGVLDAVRRASHVRPLVRLDAELAALSGTALEGIDPLRKKMDRLLEGEKVATMPHEEIIRYLDDAAGLFRVLILKTTLTFPYTSVFLELNCGYWSEASEQALRNSIGRKK